MVERKYNVGILGATGRVGRTAVDLISRHLGDKLEITYVAASPNSANKKYVEAIEGRDVVGVLPYSVANLIVQDAGNPDGAVGKCDIVLSAVEISGKDKDGRKLTSEEKNRQLIELENSYADRDIFVVSSNSPHRTSSYVPMVIPEINYKHLEIIGYQRELMHWNKGAVIVKPNCAEQSFMLPVYALIRAGYPISDMIAFTQQALSGAGDSGDSILGKKISRRPHNKDEQEKIINEPLKILGAYENNQIKNSEFPIIGALPSRDCVSDGHSAGLFIKFANKKPSLEEIKQIWNNFKPEYSIAGLCLAPENPIVYIEEHGRPRPDVDLMTGKGMTVSMGELEKSTLPFFDVQCVGFSNNMIRGAAGGALYGLEVAIAQGYVK